MRDLRKLRVNLYRRTPQVCESCTVAECASLTPIFVCIVCTVLYKKTIIAAWSALSLKNKVYLGELEINIGTRVGSCIES